MVLRVKITVLGEPDVGKTSLVAKYCKNQFPTEYRATLGADFTSKMIRHAGKNVELILWDIAGTTSFEIEQMSDFYLQGSSAYILVFDLTAKKTLKRLSFWYEKAKRICQDIPFIVIGNKNDLEEFFEVEENDISTFDNLNHWSAFLRTSAKTGENVDKAVMSLLDIILNK